MPTLKTIAEKCEMDISTVSRALNGDPKVTEETRKMIQSIADELGYTPNLAARALVAGKTRAIWMLIPGFGNAISEDPAMYASKYLDSKDYDLLIALYHGDENKAAKRMVERLSQGVADGAIVIPGTATNIDSQLQKIAESKFPLVFLDRSIEGVLAPQVTTDNAEAAADLVRYCVNQGCKSILNLFKTDNSVVLTRGNSVSETAKDFGIKEFKRDQVEQWAKLTGKTAVIANSQSELQSVLSEYKFNFSEISFALFDNWIGDISPAEKIFICIQDFQKMAETAVDLILQSFHEKLTPVVIEIPHKKIEVL